MDIGGDQRYKGVSYTIARGVGGDYADKCVLEICQEKKSLDNVSLYSFHVCFISFVSVAGRSEHI